MLNNVKERTGLERESEWSFELRVTSKGQGSTKGERNTRVSGGSSGSYNSKSSSRFGEMGIQFGGTYIYI